MYPAKLSFIIKGQIKLFHEDRPMWNVTTEKEEHRILEGILLGKFTSQEDTGEK